MKLIRTVLLIAVALAICKVFNTHAAEPGQLFREHEFGVTLGGSAAIGTAQREAEAVTTAVAIGADYFVTRNLGLGVRGELADFGHSVLDRASGRAMVRAPLWNHVAPYGYAEGGYNFEEERVFAGAGGGVEFRFTEGAGLYGELGLETTTRGAATGRAGAGLRVGF